MTTLSDLTAELAAAYDNYITFSSDLFATATATPDGNGGYIMAPADALTWTQDTTFVAGSGTAEQINISVPVQGDGTPDPYAIANGILQFTITQADGTTLQPIFGQVIGWNNGIVGFQVFDSYTTSDQNGGTGVLSNPDSAVSYFYLSNTALGAGAAPVDGTSVNTNNTLPVFLDPQYPAAPERLLLNNRGGESILARVGSVPPPAPTMVGMSFASTNVAVVGNISQDPSTLAITLEPGSVATQTFAAASLSGVSVVNAYNDAQVVELQYTNAQGQVVDIFGQVIGLSTNNNIGEMLLQVYSGFDPATGTLTHTASDASMPYVLLSSGSLASIPTTSFGITFDNTQNNIHSPSFLFGLAGSLLNLHDLFGVTSSGGMTFSSDQFAIVTNETTSGPTNYVLDTSDNWTNDQNGSIVSGGGTQEKVTVAAVYDDWQVVQFNVSGGTMGAQTRPLYGQVLAWNGAEIAFTAYDSFDPANGPSNPDPIGTFVMANTAAALDGTYTDSNQNKNSDHIFTPENSAALPVFINPLTPAPNLDLAPLVGTASFSSDDVSFVNSVQQDPTTLAFSVLPAQDENTWTFYYGQQNASAGTVSIAQVFTYTPAQGAQYQVAQVQYVPADPSATVTTTYARFLGYNADSLLFQVLDNFNTATGTWYPDFAGSLPGGGSVTEVNSAPYVVISDSSLAATNGLPVDAVFSSNGPLLPTGDVPLCFCAGTLIATQAGEVEVERLAPGDIVLTHAGAARRVVWIGHGQVMVSRGRRSAATPVIVRKSALGDNVPHTDLRLTKAHAFLVDGVLIPVEFLVNHRSIVWDDQAQEVTIYHVELASHDILLANGAPAESYRDDGNRWLFQNANSGWDMTPEPPCLPVLTGGAIVDQAWRRLLDRVGPRRGAPLTADPDVHLLVDGRRIDGSAPDDLLRIFTLPPGCGAVRMVSRSAVPAELGLARDPRNLGVAVRRLTLRQGTWFRRIDLADPALGSGFHAYEPGQGIRWTDGDAELPACLLAGRAGTLELVLHLGGSTQYLNEGENVAKVA
jgi:hypothetical protein